MEENKVSPLSLSMDNPFYVEYLKVKDKFEKKEEKRIGKNIDLSSSGYDASQLFFLCYMTKKYFLDSLIYSFFKLIFGISSVFLLILTNKIVPRIRYVKSLMMYAFLTYAIIMIPLSILYMIANFICYLTYLNYVTTVNSVVAKNLVVFYDDETDKFAAVNFKTVFKRDYASFKETRRMRGW